MMGDRPPVEYYATDPNTIRMLAASVKDELVRRVMEAAAQEIDSLKYESESRMDAIRRANYYLSEHFDIDRARATLRICVDMLS